MWGGTRAVLGCSADPCPLSPSLPHIICPPWHHPPPLLRVRSESDFDEDDDERDRSQSAGRAAASEKDLEALAGRKRTVSMSLRVSEGETKGRVLMELIESERR